MMNAAIMIINIHLHLVLTMILFQIAILDRLVQ